MDDEIYALLMNDDPIDDEEFEENDVDEENENENEDEEE